MSDSWEREKSYLFDFFCQYYIEHNEIPSLVECKDNYRNDTGYSKTGAKREYRFEEIYEWMLNYFNPEKINKKRKTGIYLKNDYIDDIKKRNHSQIFRN